MENNEMMNKYYECKRCFYKTIRKTDMTNHLNRIKKCERKIESFIYKENELYSLSLIRKDKEYLIENIDDSNNDKKNDNNNNSEVFKCLNCEIVFSTNGNLKRHTLKSCKGKCKENILYNNNTVNNNINNSNNSNSNNIYNITNNINLNVLKNFDENWSSDHININDKYDILKQNSLYTATLDKILENDKNLNVLIDENNAYIYNNNKLIKVDITRVNRKIMEKICDVIHDFGNDVQKSNIEKNQSIINNAYNIANTKFNDYRNNRNNVKNKAKKMIKNAYDNKRIKTHNIFTEIKNKSLLNNQEYIYDDNKDL